MIHDILERKFTRIGARLKLTDRVHLDRGVRLDVRTDGQGEFFEIIRGTETPAQVEVLDLQPADRHLLLMVRQDGAKSKFLCGHDERHWFVAAIPEAAAVGPSGPPRRRSSRPRSRPPRRAWGCPRRPAIGARMPPTGGRASGSSSRSGVSR